MEDSSRPATGYPVPNGRPVPGTAYPYQAPPPGTGYPYQAGPPPRPVHYNQEYLIQRRNFLRRFFGGMILCVIIIFTVLFILWVVIHPRLPEFQLTSLSVANFNVSASSSSVTGNWNARFRIYNPNKKIKIIYYEVQPSIFYKSELLSGTRISPFRQNPKNVTTVDAVLSAASYYIDGRVANEINGDRARGVVSFNLKVLANVVFKVYTTRRRLVRVFCDDVAVGYSANSGSGNFTGGAKQCRVYA